MTGFKQITNAQGAFGYGEQLDRDARGPQTMRRLHNMSSGTRIAVGDAVILSTLSTDGTGCAVTTVTASAQFVGVAVTSAGLGESTHLTSNTPSTCFCDVVIAGPVYARLSTAVVNGDLVAISSVAAGQLGAFVVSTVAGTQVIAGVAHTSGSTVAPNGSTQASRGYVTIRPSYISPSTL